MNQLFTRAGNFHLDKDGQLVNPAGKEVQGYGKDPVTGLIDINAKLSTIKVPSTTGNSNPTTEFELVFNLDGGAPVGETFTTTVQIYDSLGDVHLGTVNLVKDAVTATQTDWKFDMTIAENELLGFPTTSTNQVQLVHRCGWGYAPGGGYPGLRQQWTTDHPPMWVRLPHHRCQRLRTYRYPPRE